MVENPGRGLARVERTPAVAGTIRGRSGCLGQLQNDTWPLRYAGWACTRAPRLQRTARAIQLAGTTGISRPNLDPPALPGRSHDRQARGLRFLRSTANRAYDHKSLMKTPDSRDRLIAASAAKKLNSSLPGQLRLPREAEANRGSIAVIAARNSRIAERERDRRNGIARKVAERAAAEAAESAARGGHARPMRRLERRGLLSNNDSKPPRRPNASGSRYDARVRELGAGFLRVAAIAEPLLNVRRVMRQ